MSNYTPVTPDHIGKKVEFSNNEQSWHDQELVQILPQKDHLGIAYLGADSQGIYSLWKFARTKKEPDYRDLHRASGLKAGDWVKVTRAAKDFEAGWSSSWMPGMDRYIGSIVRINHHNDEYGFTLAGTPYLFPCFVLEKVNCRPVSEADLKKVVQYRGQSCILEALFTPRFDSTAKAVIDTNNGLKIVSQSDLSILLVDDLKNRLSKELGADVWVRGQSEFPESRPVVEGQA